MSKLNQVTRGPQTYGFRFLFYGRGGVGKSTLASWAPSPIFLDLEEGTGTLNTVRYPLDLADGIEGVESAIDDLIRNEHEFKTLVIDGIHILEAMLWRRMFDRDGPKLGKKIQSIEDYGYGKGYKIAIDEWRAFLGILDKLRKTGVHVILIGHSTISRRSNTQGIDWDWSIPAIDPRAGDVVVGWADVVGYCAAEEHAVKINDKDRRGKGYTSGRILCHTSAQPTFKAKSRLPLDEQVVMVAPSDGHPWAPFQYAIDAVQETDEQIRSAVVAAMESQDDESRAKIAAWLNTNPPRAHLRQALNDLRSA